MATPFEVAASELSAAPTRKESKGATILRLIARDQGAPLPEIMNATGLASPWRTRVHLTASKKRIIKSTRSEAGERDAGERTYTLVD